MVLLIDPDEKTIERLKADFELDPIDKDKKRW